MLRNRFMPRPYACFPQLRLPGHLLPSPHAEVVSSLPIPEEYAAMSVRRYGAHGLSYKSIVYQLEPTVPQRLIVAHRGNGASIAAIRDGRGVDTSMGLTPLGGIISGTRTGDIDPGVLLFILRKIAETAKDATEAADLLEAVVSKKSGQLSVSELSNDMRDAIAHGNAKVRLAVDMVTRTIAKWIGSYMVELGGLDTLAALFPLSATLKSAHLSQKELRHSHHSLHTGVRNGSHSWRANPDRNCAELAQQCGTPVTSFSRFHCFGDPA
jgi:acetate kinase